VQELAEAIEAAGGLAFCQQVDLCSADSVQAFFDASLAQWGRLDSVVSAVGYPIPLKPVHEFEDAMFANVVQTELVGSFHILKKGIKALQAQPGSNKSILFVLTVAFMRTIDYDGLSAIPKSAVRTMIKTAAREVGKDNIRINGIGSGGIGKRPTTLSPCRISHFLP
jgi:3-oxoacyl-[acyl-carrier protein] reductase